MVDVIATMATGGTQGERDAGDRRSGLALAFVTACVSGVAVYVNGLGVARFPDATTYTTAKNLVAAVLLLATAAVAGARSSSSGASAALTPRRWLALALVAVVGGSVPFVLFFEGLARAGSTDAAFVHKTLVVWVAILAAVFLRERIGPLQAVAVGLLVGGQAFLAGGAGSIAPGVGEAMVLVATLLWSVEVTVAKRLLATVSPITVGTARMVGGVAVLVGWAVVRGEFDTLVRLDAGAWAWAALVGGLLFGYVTTWYAALARAPAVDVTAMLVLGAIVTAVLNRSFAGASMPDPAGVVLVLTGVGTLVVVGRPPRRVAVGA